MSIYIYTYNGYMCTAHQDDAGANVVHLLHVLKADEDLWQDADMESVVAYLRASSSLVVPPAIRSVLGMD